jgi:hypothetical protein
MELRNPGKGGKNSKKSWRVALNETSAAPIIFQPARVVIWPVPKLGWQPIAEDLLISLGIFLLS